MTSAVKRVALKSLMLGLVLFACEMVWAFSKPSNAGGPSRRQAMVNPGQQQQQQREAVGEQGALKRKKDKWVALLSGQNVAENLRSEHRTGAGLALPENNAGDQVVEYGGATEQATGNGAAGVAGNYQQKQVDVPTQEESQTRDGAGSREDIIFEHHGIFHINLDSEGWQGTTGYVGSQMALIRETLKIEGTFINIQCTNPTDHVTLEKPITTLSGDKFVVGHMDRNVKRYSVISLGVDLRDKQTDTYAFYAPLTALAWVRINYGVVVIITDTLANWLSQPITRHVMSYICQTGATMFFIPTPKDKMPLVSQVAKLFAAPLMEEYHLTLGSHGYENVHDIPNPFLILADIDVWTLYRHVYSTNSSIISLNNGCCQWFQHKEWRLKSWPMSYLRLRVDTLWDLVQENTAMRRGVALTSYAMIAVMRQEFGELVDGELGRGQGESWFVPQYLSSIWINNYIRMRGANHVTFADRPGPRMDRQNWDHNISPAADSDTKLYFDVHLPRIARTTYKNDAWSLLNTLLKHMYGAGSPEFHWCATYHRIYMQIMKEFESGAKKLQEPAKPDIGTIQAQPTATPKPEPMVSESSTIATQTSQQLVEQETEEYDDYQSSEAVVPQQPAFRQIGSKFGKGRSIHNKKVHMYRTQSHGKMAHQLGGQRNHPARQITQRTQYQPDDNFGANDNDYDDESDDENVQAYSKEPIAKHGTRMRKYASSSSNHPRRTHGPHHGQHQSGRQVPVHYQTDLEQQEYDAGDDDDTMEMENVTPSDQQVDVTPSDGHVLYVT